MSKEMLATPQSNKVECFPETPFLRAKEEWDNRIGSSVVQAKNWRLVAIILSISFLMLSTGSIYLGSLKKEVPIIVTLDLSSGQTNVLGFAKSIKYEPRIQEIKYFLSSFINKVRAVPIDPVIIKQNWNDAYVFLKREAAIKLNNQVNTDKNNPLNNIGTETVIVEPISVNQVANSSSYQARWSETRYNKNGGLIDSYTMSGVFSLEIETPDSEAVIRVNPLGIFITNFSWSREL